MTELSCRTLRPGRFGWLLALCLLLLSSGGPLNAASWGGKRIDGVVAEKAGRSQTVEALVLLDDRDEMTVEAGKAYDPGDRLAYGRRMKERRQRLAAAKKRLLAESFDSGLSVVGDYDLLPVLHVKFKSARALDKLARHARVLTVEENRASEAHLLQSLPLIGQADAASLGALGSGGTVAVLDTGVDYARATFGSCTAPGAPATCRVIYAQDFAPDDGIRDVAPYHGSNVAGIVLGAAPGARIAALDVFRADGYAYISDILAAINWCVANRDAYNIVTINMSLGGGRYYSQIEPADAWGTAIQRAVDAGIVVVASAGNSAYRDSLCAPAAYRNVVSVGAVYDAGIGRRNWAVCSDATTAADKVACFSNSAPFLTLLAPGSLIASAGVSMSGTSQAGPHVAGAAAVLRSAFPSDSVAGITARMLNGPLITDPRNGISKPRLDLSTALEGVMSSYLLTTSVMPPESGSITPADGSFAVGTELTLTAQAADGYEFTSWGGACAGQPGETCALLMNQDQEVSASFSPSMVPANTPPLAVDDSVVTAEDIPSAISVLANDSDADGDPLTVSAFSQPNHGAVVSAQGGVLTYTPAGDYSGTDSFSYTLSDGRGGTDTAMVSITVAPVNDPPVVNAGPDQSATVGQAVVFSASGTSDPDPGDTLAYAWDFGDGTRGDGVSPSHAYLAPGNYRVVLTVTDGVGVAVQDSLAVTVADVPQLAMLSFESASHKVSEGIGGAVLKVLRTGPLDSSAGVRYTTGDGMARVFSDYKSTTGYLAWPAGDGSPREIVVQINNDRYREFPEYFYVRLSSVSGAVLGISTATVTIVDND